MISCEQHDYIEIACMFRYPIKLTMHSGIVIECIAVDTTLNDNKLECIKVDFKEGETLIIIDDIAQLDVCIDNPHFHTISFNLPLA